ncbi:MAG: RlmE family RNA methyltransferase [Thermoplasmata archaeon]
MGRRFVEERRHDPYYRAAQQAELRSRAAFKLVYLAERFPLFHQGDDVLDLGAAPGGWSMIARACLRDRGSVTAVDPRPIVPIPGVTVLRARVGDAELPARLGGRRFTVVLSDMSPSISGAYATDHARSVDLANRALHLADQVLIGGGALVAKVFAGDMLDDLEVEWKRRFTRVVRTKPAASRERSSELYLLGFGFRQPSEPPGHAG